MNKRKFQFVENDSNISSNYFMFFCSTYIYVYLNIIVQQTQRLMQGTEINSTAQEHPCHSFSYRVCADSVCKFMRAYTLI